MAKWETAKWEMAKWHVTVQLLYKNSQKQNDKQNITKATYYTITSGCQKRYV